MFIDNASSSPSSSSPPSSSPSSLSCWSLTHLLEHRPVPFLQWSRWTRFLISFNSSAWDDGSHSLTYTGTLYNNNATYNSTAQHTTQPNPTHSLYLYSWEHYKDSSVLDIQCIQFNSSWTFNIIHYWNLVSLPPLSSTYHRQHRHHHHPPPPLVPLRLRNKFDISQSYIDRGLYFFDNPPGRDDWAYVNPRNTIAQYLYLFAWNAHRAANQQSPTASKPLMVGYSERTMWIPLTVSRYITLVARGEVLIEPRDYITIYLWGTQTSCCVFPDFQWMQWKGWFHFLGTYQRSPPLSPPSPPVPLSLPSTDAGEPSNISKATPITCISFGILLMYIIVMGAAM